MTRVRGAFDPFGALSVGTALVNIALGVIVLTGWATSIRELISLPLGGLPAKANAALLLILAGVALLLWRSERATRRAVTRLLGLAMVAVAGVTLLEYLTVRAWGSIR